MMKYCHLRRFGLVGSLVAATILCVLTGCRHESHDAAVRLINAAPGVQATSIAVDGQVVWKNSQFGSNSGYHGIKAGSYKIAVNDDPAGDSAAGIMSIDCVKGKAYTIVDFGSVAGASGQPKLRIFVDALKMPVPRDKARIQFINAGNGIGHVDVLFDRIVGFANVPLGARSAPIVLSSGTYGLRLNKANQVQTLADLGTVHFLPGRSYTLVAMGIDRDAQNGPRLAVYSDSR